MNPWLKQTIISIACTKRIVLNKKLILLFTLFLGIITANNVSAQCSGVVLGGYMCNPIANITTTAQMNAGTTSGSCIHLAYAQNAGVSCNGWKLKVRAASANFSNGTYTMPVQYANIQFAGTTGGPSAAAMGMNTSAISLSTTEKVLVSNGSSFSAPPSYNFEHLFNVNLQGGSNLYLHGNGNYSVDLIFNLYNSSNVLVSSTTMTATFQYNYQGANLFDECGDVTLNGLIASPLTQYTTYSQLMSGSTISQAVSIVYYLVSTSTNCPGWSLRVRAVNPSFTNGTSSIPVSSVSLRFNSVSNGPTASAIGVSYNPVQLSTADMPLITSSGARLVSPPDNSVTHRFDAIIQGGPLLIQPDNGSFTNTLVFSFYDASNQLVSSWTTPVSIQIYYNASSSTIVLQNSANTASFVLNSPSAITAGQSLSKPNGLKVTAYNNYQIFAQTTNANLVSSTTSAVLPVSVIQLQSTMNSGISGVTCNTITLSNNNSQPLITNTNPAYPNQIVEYNLRYFISPNNTTIQQATPATYTGTLVFVTVPL